MDQVTAVQPLAYSMTDAARALGISRPGMYVLAKVHAGELDIRKLGGRTVVTVESLKRFLDSRPKASFAAAVAA